MRFSLERNNNQPTTDFVSKAFHFITTENHLKNGIFVLHKFTFKPFTKNVGMQNNESIFF